MSFPHIISANGRSLLQLGQSLMRCAVVGSLMNVGPQSSQTDLHRAAMQSLKQ